MQIGGDSQNDTREGIHAVNIAETYLRSVYSIGASIHELVGIQCIHGHAELLLAT